MPNPDGIATPETPPAADAPPASEATPATVKIQLSGKEYEFPADAAAAIQASLAGARKDRGKDTAASAATAELKEAQARVQELETEKQTAEDAKLSESERAKKDNTRAAEKAAQQLSDATTRADKAERQYQETKINTAILEAIPSADVVDVADVKTLFLAHAKAEYRNENGSGEKVIILMPDGSGGTDEMEPGTAVKHFLALSGKTHLLNASVRQGAGTSETATRGKGGALEYTREQMQSLATRKEFAEKKKAGQDVKIV